MTKKIILITGNRESGKTSLCLEIVNYARENGLSVTGLISPKSFENGKANRILCLDLKSTEKTVLAVWEPGWDALNSARDWKINPDASEWGNERLASIISSDVLIVDELGYREFVQNTGWMNAFNLIGKQEIGIAIVVVRPSLLPKAKEHWPNAVEMNLDRNLRAEIIKTLKKQLQAVTKEKERNSDRDGDIK